MTLLVVLSLLFTGAFLVLLVLEILVRVVFRVRVKQPPDNRSAQGKTYLDAYDDPNEGIQFPPWVEPKIEYSTYLGFITTANVITRSYSTNSHHFRYDENFATEKGPNEIRIFVTGGSKAWGAGVTQAALYTQLIEKEFSSRYPEKRVRVICAAGPAYCSTQERIMVENIVLRLSPDYVVMFSGRNDCYFGYSGKDTILDQDYFDYERVLSPGKFSKVGPASHEHYSVKLLFLFHRLTRSRGVEPARRQSVDPVKAINTFLTNIHILGDISKRHQFKLMVYLEPSIFTTEKHLSEWEQSVLERSSTRFPKLQEYSRELYSRLKKILPQDAIDNNYLFIDGDNAIGGEVKSVFSDNVHFGDRGYRLIASHLFAILDRTLSETLNLQ